MKFEIYKIELTEPIFTYIVKWLNYIYTNFLVQNRLNIIQINQKSSCTMYIAIL